MLSIWEYYVHNLLSEAYNHVVYIDSETSTPRDSSDDGSNPPGSYKDLRKIKKKRGAQLPEGDSGRYKAKEELNL